MKDKKRYLTLNDLSAYKISLGLSNYVWNIVEKWDFFKKKTVGGQFVRSVDSISANIAEGFGRYHKKDKIHFYKISYGSVTESLDWNEKAKTRILLTDEEYNHIFQELTKLPKEINHLISFTDKRLSI
jgi:four helix bundle protein